MNILHLATFLQGGAGRVITDLALEQHRTGHEVRVVTSSTGAPGYSNYQAYVDELGAAGVSVRLVDSMFERRHAPNLAVVQALDGMYPLGAEPDVVHSHAAIPSLVALLFAGARRSATTLVQTMHGWGVVKTPDQVASDVALLNMVDRVVVPSGHAAGLLASLGVAPARISIVSYGVRPYSGETDSADAGTLHEMAKMRRDGVLVIACVGTLSARKNQTLLVEALARMPGTPACGVFVGDGDARHLLEVVKRTGQAGRVRVHGYSPAARRIAAAADLLVLPSQSEGQPVAVLEAFCDGTLVTVSDIPELAELVVDGAHGFHFTAGDADALADVLGRVATLSNSTRRAIRERARARYASQFTVLAMTNAYLEIYRALAGVPGTDGRRRESPAA